MTQATELIDALNGTFGRHRHYRASHAKGFAVSGRFIPSDDDHGAVRIPLLRSEQPVAARLSVGGGNPGVSDKSPTVRGAGVTIGALPEVWTMALISAPIFFANSAEQFKAFLAARVPDPEIGGPNPEMVKAFNADNPNTIPHQQYLKSTPPCRCYSTERYHSGHAYAVRTADGDVAARLLLEPEAGRHGLTDDEKAGFPDDYLQDTLRDKLSMGPVRWALKLVVANASDELLDPTVPWDGDHDELTLGALEIGAMDFSDVAKEHVFDPTDMPDGVCAPKDRIFPLRSAAYAESYARRSEDN